MLSLYRFEAQQTAVWLNSFLLHSLLLFKFLLSGISLTAKDGSLLSILLDKVDLLLSQVIKVIDDLVDLLVGGGDLTLQGGAFEVGLGGSELLVEV